MVQWRLLLSLVVMTFASFAAGAQSDAPSLAKVYEQWRWNHVQEARGTLRELLREYPDDARSHYVMAELYASDGEYDRARAELTAAKRLAPGLPFARPDVVRVLTAEVSEPMALEPTRVLSAPLPMHLAVPVVTIAGLSILWILYRVSLMKPSDTTLTKNRDRQR